MPIDLEKGEEGPGFERTTSEDVAEPHSASRELEQELRSPVTDTSSLTLIGTAKDRFPPALLA